MLGSVPRWPCGYIQRPYLLLRFLVLLSLPLSLFHSLSPPPSFLLFLSRHAFDMRISKYTHASSRNVLLSDDPLFLPATSCFDIFTRRSVRFPLILLVSRFVGGPIIISPKITIQFDLLWDFSFMKIFKEDYSVERWKIFFIVMIVVYLNNLRNYYTLFNNLDSRWR